jgi:hypothetical protein
MAEDTRVVRLHLIRRKHRTPIKFQGVPDLKTLVFVRTRKRERKQYPIYKQVLQKPVVVINIPQAIADKLGKKCGLEIGFFF